MIPSISIQRGLVYFRRYYQRVGFFIFLCFELTMHSLELQVAEVESNAMDAPKSLQAHGYTPRKTHPRRCFIHLHSSPYFCWATLRVSRLRPSFLASCSLGSEPRREMMPFLTLYKPSPSSTNSFGLPSRPMRRSLPTGWRNTFKPIKW